MEIMPVGPFVKTCFSFFLLFAKMGKESLLVIGSYRAVRHDQCCMKIPVVDCFQCINIEIGYAP